MRAVCRQIDMGITKIGVVGQREFEIECTKRVQIGRSLCDLVVSRVLDGICQAVCRVAESLDIAEFAGRDLSDITFDRDFFFRLVHFAVVKNEPAKRIGLAFFVPVAAVLPIIFGIFGQKCDVLAAFGDQHILLLFRRRVRQRQTQNAVVAGLV